MEPHKFSGGTDSRKAEAHLVMNLSGRRISVPATINHARYLARAACEGGNLTNIGVKMASAERIAAYLRKIKTPASAADIADALKIKAPTVKAALFALTENGHVVHVGRHNATRYAVAPPKPPGPMACTAPTVCNGSMSAPLVYSAMHSDRPGAMDYQHIPSLVGRDRVPYRAGVVR